MPVTTNIATPGAIEVRRRARAASEREAEALLNELGDKIELALGDHIFSSHGEYLEEVVGMYLVMKHKTVAVAESCTGGLLSERLPRTQGSSNFYAGGAVCYSDDLKTKMAGGPRALIEENGAVSKPVGHARAEGIRKRAAAAPGTLSTRGA